MPQWRPRRAHITQRMLPPNFFCKSSLFPQRRRGCFTSFRMREQGTLRETAIKSSTMKSLRMAMPFNLWQHSLPPGWNPTANGLRRRICRQEHD